MNRQQIMEEEILPVPTDATNQEEELDLELELDDTEDVEAIKEKAEKMEAFARQTLARAKKAEEELKGYKSKPVESATQTIPSNASVEETVLLANGMPEELLEELKAVAKVRNISLLKAQNDPIFVAMKGNFEKEQKQKEASLPASRGSGQAKVKKTFNTPGLTEAERKAMFHAQFN